MYRVELTPRAQRDLDRLRGDDLERVAAVVRGLSEDPRPPKVRKLRGPIYRVRAGEWRIIYAVFDKDRLVIVGKLARRSKRTYEDLEELF